MMSVRTSAHYYLGFDRNNYPGDGTLPRLRKTFSYSGYWLNNPPGETSNTWLGKRSLLQSHGLGFLVLFNGRSYMELRAPTDPTALGKSDASAAVDTAKKREGFPPGTIVFLDQEEGGRLHPEQRAYLHAWVDGVNRTEYRAGVYCSGIPAKEADGGVVITANDIRDNAGGRRIVYWVYNDACGPSPGCVFPKNPPPPAASGVVFADVWQFAQSPSRKDMTDGCASKYDSHGNCYPPGFDSSNPIYVDVNTATSPDPSRGRR